MEELVRLDNEFVTLEDWFKRKRLQFRIEEEAEVKKREIVAKEKEDGLRCKDYREIERDFAGVKPMKVEYKLSRKWIYFNYSNG